MMYTVIYIDNSGERKWKKVSDIKTAEDYGKSMSDNYDLCIPLYEYDKLEKELKTLKETLKQIATICEST